MRTEKVELTAVSQSLYDLGGFADNPQCNEVLIQSAIGNANIVYFGQKGKEFGELNNTGSSAGLHVMDLHNVFVKGTPPDQLIIHVL